jgi:tryptophan synthase beta subunit
MKKLNIIMNLIKQDLKLNNSDSNIGGVYMEEKIYEILVKVQKDVEQINFNEKFKDHLKEANILYKGIDYRVTLLEA